MATQALAARVDRVEQRVTLLEELPGRVDALALQVSQLRDEMHTEFSAVRNEIRAGDEETRRVLRDEIRAGDERVMGQARVLHEDIVSRLALIQEGGRASSPRRKR
jgi:predicted phage gp36 major capsid-like protein